MHRASQLGLKRPVFELEGIDRRAVDFIGDLDVAARGWASGDDEQNRCDCEI